MQFFALRFLTVCHQTYLSLGWGVGMYEIVESLSRFWVRIWGVGEGVRYGEGGSGLGWGGGGGVGRGGHCLGRGRACVGVQSVPWSGSEWKRMCVEESGYRFTWAGGAVSRRDAHVSISVSTIATTLVETIATTIVNAAVNVNPPRSGGPPAVSPPPSCTDWTRLVLLPVLTGHVSSFSPY